MAPSLRSLKTNPNIPIPTHFRCPISLDLMTDPVTLPTGITYDRDGIETWLDSSCTCPVTNQPIGAGHELTPNHAIRRMIQDWCVANGPYGIDRIPTPRVPVTPARAAEILREAEFASARFDRAKFLDTAVEIGELVKDSERNRRGISSNGGGRVLAMSFARFACDEGVCLEILSLLTHMFPLDDEACAHFESTEAVRGLVSVLQSGHLEGRLNAASLVKELAVDARRAKTLAGTEGLVEAIARMINKRISSNATKSSLAAAYYLALASERARSRLVGSGVVASLLEVLVDSDKSACEKALGVLDAVFSEESAREEAYGHALAVPVLVKKMFRVSDAATEFAVAAIWKLCKECDAARRTGLALDALSVGAFQKLLLLLQLGCSEGTKLKASELLRMMNGCRGNGECIESSDFRGIKRSF